MGRVTYEQAVLGLSWNGEAWAVRIVCAAADDSVWLNLDGEACDWTDRALWHTRKEAESAPVSQAMCPSCKRTLVRVRRRHKP